MAASLDKAGLAYDFDGDYEVYNPEKHEVYAIHFIKEEKKLQPPISNMITPYLLPETPVTVAQSQHHPLLGYYSAVTS